ncbi:uncharacterized protein LOC132255915 [Phlebotomus argentipes]|uniref:uncharacterized protein LOC132255915 n=1 Tax=Phlebotomus argentipes TaxID=94469 RepID=UPI002892EAF5|nr:uncharacterized protein LOC132255915 [Phlebotomus argentipes]
MVQFLQFLRERLKSIAQYNSYPAKSSSQATKSTPAGPTSNKNLKPQKATVLSATAQSPCPGCKKEGHKLFKCHKFIAMPSIERLELVRNNKLCRKCITETHLTKDCTFFTCRKYSKHHNTLLHEAFQSESSQSTPAQQQTQSNDRPTDTSQSDSTAIVGSSTASRPAVKVFLETVVVRVLDKFGVPQLCRALLDSGAQVNLISQPLFQRLRLPKSLSDVYIGRVVGGGAKSKFQAECCVQAVDNQDVHFSMTCQIVPAVLEQKLPNWKVRVDQIAIPSEISLADPTWHVSQPIDLLISNEFYNEIFTRQIMRLGKGLPILKESCFGWVVSGAHASSSQTRQSDQVAYVGTTLASIDSSVRKFWEIEEVSTAHPKTLDHEIVENCFQESTVRDDTGRYVVKIPFRPSLVRLHNNLPNATRQFLSLERRLSANPEIKSQYHAAMQENFDLRFFEEVPPDEITSTSYYMPHHAVAKKSSSGVKVRIVMNASSKSQTGLSLNYVAMVGPTVQPDIVAILLRFREHPFAFCCDIQKMYPQVLIHPSHKDSHRIVWRFRDSEPIRHYRARGVCFGVSSSPYLATRVLIDLADREEIKFPLAAKALKENFYVDDCLASCPSISDALETQRQLKELLSSAGMTLAKWCVSSPEITEEVEPSQVRSIFPEQSKALGMLWHPQDDVFVFQLTRDFIDVNSKREVLAAIASLYDPLGFVSPVIVIGKLIMQALWKEEKLDWDDPLPEHISSQWKQLAEGLPTLQEIKVQRPMSTLTSPKSTELHVFCDSSSVAYGAVAYVVTEDDIHGRQSQILMAKSRIAPTSSITIPKLELCAAALGSQLAHKIRNALSVTEYFLWTDSTIVLGQIRSNRIKFDVFTAHRIAEILRLTDVSKWQHVPGASNPADVVSRGMLPTELKSSSIWWTGPEFLLGKAENWPQDPYSVTLIASSTAIINQVPESHILDTILERSSSYLRIQRILAYVLRVLTGSPSRIRGPITSQELLKSEHKLVSFAQAQHLAEVRSAIADGTMWTSRRFAHVRHLTPFIDGEGIIRVGGRLAQSPANYDARHPILLPKCRLATIIATHTHKNNMHAGPQLLLATLRQKYWPLGGRNLTRNVARSCVVCWKTKPIRQEQRMGDLPTSRTDHVAPFKVCGIDFCGPVLTRPSYKRGGTSYKTYICALVCFTTKAIHLEVVGSLSSEGFVAALRRFAARRAAPSDIFCDNATNFRGASAELAKFLRDIQSSPDVVSEAAPKGINWHFAPPRSPHHGGLYEAAIKSLKHHLAREVGQTILTFEELNTIVAQIEAILNSRPITPLSEDPNEMFALTPGHFLVGRPLNALPDQTLTDVAPNRLSRWQLCQKILQHFAHRWRKEYLHLLQKRVKWTQEADNLKIGDIVLIGDDSMATHQWPMGIIEELHPGRDGRCRVVTIRTARGKDKRAVQRLSKLPIEGLPPSSSAPPPPGC